MPENISKKVHGSRILVLAPHPDDEVFGCGGAIIRHIQQGDAVKVVIVSDGGLPVIEQQKTDNYPQIRKNESNTAAGILGYGKPDFLNYPDGKLKSEARLDKHLLKIIEDFQPQNIYLPSETEIHPDHIALNKTAVDAVKNFPQNLNLFFYEIGQPLHANFFLDITDLQPTLDRAMDCFKSQQAVQDYKTHIRSLHAYRSYPLGKDVKFAEAYRLIKSNELKTGEKIWQEKLINDAAKQPTFKTNEGFPLISVVVRTMNRMQLPEALESIAAQTYPNLEVIVVDARGEKSLLLGEACGKFPLRLISKGKPLNRPEAANTGLDAVQGEYFCFLDEDDLLFPGHIEVLFDKLKNNEAGTAYGIIREVNMASGEETIYNTDFDVHRLLKENFIPNLACLFHSDLLRNGCRYDEEFDIYEDWDFLIQAAHQADFLFVKHLVGTYRNFGSSSIHSNMSDVFKYRRKMFLKWIPKVSDEEFGVLISSKHEEANGRVFVENAKLLRQIETILDENEALKSEKSQLLNQISTPVKTNKNGIIGKLKRFYHHAKPPVNNQKKEVDDAIAEDIRLIENSSLFDADFYLSTYQDVKNAATDPITHYLEFGGFEGRKPSRKFDGAFYLETYPDVKAAKINPLLHYLKFGQAENRLIQRNSMGLNSLDKQKLIEQRQAELINFISSGGQIDLTCENPQISIILVLFNQAELTLACLRSIREFADLPVEVIIVDNHSTDYTSDLLDRVRVTKVVRNNENLHFVKACNQALELVTTPYVLLLNNDTEIGKNALSLALNTLNENSEFGAVGAKIVRYDGTLQEAGNIIWSDGSCQGYGRDDDPGFAQYNFKRIVDYCSAAFLLTRTSLFKEHGGFDTGFAPAYYEETDYCLWLRENGFNVVYDPNVVVRHFEFGSSTLEDSTRLMRKNRQVFIDKHKHTLKNHFDNHASNIEKARFAASCSNKKRLLYIDDRVPHSWLGRGYPRSNAIVKVLYELGYQITIYPNTFPDEEPANLLYKDINPFIEVVSGFGVSGFRDFMAGRRDYYDLIWVSRPHNMKFLKERLFIPGRKYKLIYDAEAIFAERELMHAQLLGDDTNAKTKEEQIREEIGLADNADLVIAVSGQDAKKFKDYGVHDVKVLGHCPETKIGEKTFGGRKDLLFVGNLDYPDAPNTDSIIWFIETVFPLIQKSIPEISLHVVGSFHEELLGIYKSVNVCFHGFVDDPAEFYDTCRVFVAPTRFSAGIPYKVHEAASYGIPVVATKLLAEQLGWADQKQLLVAEVNPNAFSSAVVQLYANEELWSGIRENAATEILQNHSKQSFVNTIRDILTRLFHPSEKVSDHWSDMDIEVKYSPDVYWLANRLVQNNFTKKVTSGSESESWVNYVNDKYLSALQPDDTLLSIGCGDGELERHLSSLGGVKNIEAFDIAPARIEKAINAARENSITNVEYFVRDAEKHGLPNRKYKVVFFNSSLHHLRDVDGILANTAACLKPGGYMILNEYVGPNRLRYSEKEKTIIRQVFKEIPEKYRVSLAKENYGKVIREPLFFNPEEVERVDPSEAVNSEAIIPAVKKFFHILEFNEAGGTLLHVLLQNIAGHFREDDAESIKILQSLFEKEQALISSGELPNHFAFIVATAKE
jgi:GT2 family glycosyltransferase/LmbE family N-acetylglucosaminyl deacetylase/2-polyprenyl-3-methyl-5-hydroxy-6-metoxy-1,4-benzoquinol methylase